MLAGIWEGICHAVQQPEAFVALVTVVMLYIFFHDVEVRLPFFGRPEEVEEEDTRPTRTMADFIKGRSLPKKHPAAIRPRTSPPASSRGHKTSPPPAMSRERSGESLKSALSGRSRERSSPPPPAWSREHRVSQATPHRQAPPREGDGALRHGSRSATWTEPKHLPQAASHERKRSPQAPPREREGGPHQGSPSGVARERRLSLPGPSREEGPEGAPRRGSLPATPNEPKRSLPAALHERKRSPQAARCGHRPAERQMTSEAMQAQSRRDAPNAQGAPSNHDRGRAQEGPRAAKGPGRTTYDIQDGRCAFVGSSLSSAAVPPGPSSSSCGSLAVGRERSLLAGVDEPGPLSEDVIRMIVKPLPQALAAKI